MIFDSSLPEEPPDFIFLNSDQNFLPEFEELRVRRFDRPTGILVILKHYLDKKKNKFIETLSPFSKWFTLNFSNYLKLFKLWWKYLI